MDDKELDLLRGGLEAAKKLSELSSTNLEREKFKRAKYEFDKTQEQQGDIIRWFKLMSTIWGCIIVVFLFAVIFSVTISFSVFSVTFATNDLNNYVAIALITSGTSTAVLGPMLVAYAVFRKKFKGGLLAEATKSASKNIS